MRIRPILGLAGLCLLSLLTPGKALATEQDHQNANNETGEAVVTVMAGSGFGGDAILVQDLTQVLAKQPGLRVIPMVGSGPAQTLKDVLTVPGVDMGLTHATLLNHAAKTGMFGPIKDRLVYVAKLFNEDVHLLARSDVADIEALAGKKVNIGLEGSGTAIAAAMIFEALGFRVEAAHLAPAAAVRALKDGEIDATFLIGATPMARLARTIDTTEVKLLSIPYAEALEEAAYPAVLTHDDYPSLIEKGARVDTIAVCAVLVALDRPEDAGRQARLARFIDGFFSNFAALQEAPHHPKWRDVNLAATLEDWRRAPIAEAWIEQANITAAAEASERARFKAFLRQAGNEAGTREDARVSEAEQERLFKAFQAWSSTQQAN